MLKHTVKKGETLEVIAKRYGFQNAAMVFYAPCNQKLRFFRNKADQIKAGDVVRIPDDAVNAAQIKLENLRKIRAEYLVMNENILREWDGEYNRINRVADNIDIAKKVIDVCMGITGIVKEGFSAMKLSGVLLEDANKKLAKSAVKFGYEPLVGVAKEQAAVFATGVNVGDGVAMAIGKDVLHFFLVDWDTPSYWASKISGVDIKETNSKVINEIETQKTRTLKNLDMQIAQAQSKLAGLQRIRNGHIPVLY